MTNAERDSEIDGSSVLAKLESLVGTLSARESQLLRTMIDSVNDPVARIAREGEALFTAEERRVLSALVHPKRRLPLVG